jgi:hypothetical protein
MSIRNTLLVLLFGSLAGFLLLREQQRGTLEPLDRAHREFLKANPDPAQATRSAPEASIVFARMDDVDQPNRVFAAWPLEPADWLIILQNLPGYRPKAVALAAPLPAGPPLPALQEAAKHVPGLLSCVQASVIAGDGTKELPPALPVLTVRGKTDAIPEFAALNLPAIPGAPAVERIDFAPKDRRLSVDGDACRVPMLARMGDKVVPSLALRALMEWAQVSPADVKVQTGAAITAGSKLRIPIDAGGFFRYYLSLAPQVPAMNADEFVLSRPAAGATPAPGISALETADKAADSLLWFGYDDKASRSLKLPNGSPVSPAELTARAIAAIQTGAFMRPLEQQQQWLAPAAALLFCVWLAHWRKSWLLPGALLGAALLAGVSLFLYRDRQEWMPLGPALGIIAATAVLIFILPPRPRRGKPATLPGTRTAATRRTRPQATMEPASLPTGTSAGTISPPPQPPTAAEEPSPAREPATSGMIKLPPPEPEPTAERAPESPPEPETPGDETLPAEPAPMAAGETDSPQEEPTDDTSPAPLHEPMHPRKKSKKKRRR